MDTKIEGYAAVFNQETIIANLFRERIALGAFAESLKRDDPRALLNHDANLLLGRKSAGTLTLSEDAKGLRYVVQLNPDDPFAASVAARIRRKDITGSSFQFAVDGPDDEEWEPPARRGGLPLRTFLKLRLLDVSPVTFPQYIQTSVSAVRTDPTAKQKLDLIRARIAIERAKAWGAI